MKADTFAKLVILEVLIDAEIGYYLEHHPPPEDRFREEMVSRVSDLVDDIDALDAVAAARVYDAVVDFLAELPEDDEGAVEATLRFKRTVDRLIDRAMDRRELQAPPTWATVLDELLDALADEYHAAIRPSGEVLPREYLRARLLLHRSRDAAERMVRREAEERRAEVRDAMDRVVFAVSSRRLKPAAVDHLIRVPQRLARRRRPSNLTRIGGFVISQLIRRRPAAGEGGAS